MFLAFFMNKCIGIIKYEINKNTFIFSPSLGLITVLSDKCQTPKIFQFSLVKTPASQFIILESIEHGDEYVKN